MQEICQNDKDLDTTGERTLVIYANESSEKNRAYREALAGNFEAAKAELKPLVEQFQNAVVSGRPNIQKEEKGVLSGASLTGLNLSYNGSQDLNFGVQAKAGYFVEDDWMLLAHFRIVKLNYFIYLEADTEYRV